MLDGVQFKQFQKALQSAFPSIAALRMMVRTGLNENLGSIASEQNLTQCAFDLVTWAETNEKTEELIKAARLENSGNLDLRRFVEEFNSRDVKSPVAPRLSDGKTSEEKKPLAGTPNPQVPAKTQPIPATASFGILHLTDLHYGLKSQEKYLPGVLANFFDDLETLYSQSGPWDLVLFSGDLVQSGTTAQFTELQTLLDDIWEHLRKLGSPDPILLAVPGNHDLARPDPDLPAVFVLQDLAGSGARGEKVWEGVLSSDPSNPYRAVLNQSFQAYSDWWENCPYNGKNHANLKYHAGPLPGDFSAVLEKEGARLGIVGLNTTFLQLTGDNFEGKLALDVRQFNRTCEEKGARWFTNNIDACVLMTHQPPSWLAEANRREVFYPEIDIPGRFVAHFCGHMHAPDAETRGSGWSQERRLVRGGSLFGLETSADGKTERIHAYASCRIELPTGATTGNIRLWPRIYLPRAGGQFEFDRDTKYSLDRTKNDSGTQGQPFNRLRNP